MYISCQIFQLPMWCKYLVLFPFVLQINSKRFVLFVYFFLIHIVFSLPPSVVAWIPPLRGLNKGFITACQSCIWEQLLPAPPCSPGGRWQCDSSVDESAVTTLEPMDENVAFSRRLGSAWPHRRADSCDDTVQMSRPFIPADVSLLRLLWFFYFFSPRCSLGESRSVWSCSRVSPSSSSSSASSTLRSSSFSLPITLTVLSRDTNRSGKKTQCGGNVVWIF